MKNARDSAHPAHISVMRYTCSRIAISVKFAIVASEKLCYDNCVADLRVWWNWQTRWI